MRADTLKPPPNAPLDWVCVECGKVKQKHNGHRFWCQPVDLYECVSPSLSIRVTGLETSRSEAWRKFR